MAAGRYDFEIEQGADFNRTITWYQDALRQSPVDLSNYTVKMKVRDSISKKFVLVEADLGLALGGVAGTIQLHIPAAKTSQLRPGDGVLEYDLILTASGGAVVRLLEGQVTISAQVT